MYHKEIYIDNEQKEGGGDGLKDNEVSWSSKIEVRVIF